MHRLFAHKTSSYIDQPNSILLSVAPNIFACTARFYSTPPHAAHVPN